MRDHNGSGFTLGRRVTFQESFGLGRHKSGVIISHTRIITDGRGVPVGAHGGEFVGGDYKPVDWSKSVAVQYDDGRIDVVAKYFIKRYRNR